MFSAHTVGGAAIFKQRDSIGHAFDFDAHDLGRSLMLTAAVEMKVSMATETDPDGMPWPDLSPSYEEWKSGVAPGAPMSVLYGHMAAFEQIAGEQTVTQFQAYMSYGIDDLARIEAVKFTLGGIVTGTRQPQRPFYGLTPTAVILISQQLDTVFAKAW